VFLSRGILVFLACCCLGHAPALLYNFQHPAAFVYRFGGRILDLDRSFLSSGDKAGVIFEKIKWRVSTMPDSLLRIPRLLLPLMGAAETPFGSACVSYIFVPLIYWISFVYAFFARIRQKIRPLDVCIVFAVVFVLFYVCLVGEDHARYMLPLYTVIPVFLGVFFLKIKEKSVFLFSALVLLILTVNIAGNVKMLMSGPVSFSGVVNFLSEKDITKGYSDYSTSYGIIFESGEKIIISPTLLTDRFDRYPEYTKEVNSARNVAYIFKKAGGSWEPFEKRLEEERVRFNKEDIDTYIIYWDLSERIFP
jgi:hypothetical protein